MIGLTNNPFWLFFFWPWFFLFLHLSAPTSGGKTLVFELLLLRALLRHNNTMAILVVPFIALAMEKRDYLRDVWAPLQVRFFSAEAL